MRILLVNTLFPPVIKGGAEVSTYNLALALVARGYDVHVLTMSPDTNSTEHRDGMTIHKMTPEIVSYPYDGEGPSAGGKTVYHLLENYNPLMYRKLRKLIAAIKPDIVHTNIMQLFSCAIWYAAQHESVPVVHNLRDYWLLCVRSGFFRDGKPCSRKCLDCAVIGRPRRSMTSGVDAVVAVGQYVLDTHLAAGLFDQVKVARAILSATEPVPAATRDRSRGKEIVLGYIGRIKESKGVHVLLEALAKVPTAIPVRLVIGGTGDEPYIERLRAMADTRVSFLGWITPVDFYSQCDVVAVPSLYPEPLPRTVLEAYSYGLPVIGASSGGIPEVVEEGETGWLYAADDVDRLSQLIAQLPGQQGVAAVSRSAIDAVLARTDPAYVVGQYEDIYRTIAKPGARARMPARAASSAVS